jgi:CBS domain containing-hemolysin-like protein
LQRTVDGDAHPVALGVFAAFMLLLTGSLPAAITQVRADRLLLAVLPFVRGAWWVLRWPLVLPVQWLTKLCLHVLGVRREDKAGTAEVQKQVIAAVADSVTEDTLAGEERAWIGNIVALKDLQVSAVMRPRPDIVAFPASMPLREAVQQAMEHGFSRYPVFEERIDEIAGIFYVKDALKVLHADAERGGDGRTGDGHAGERGHADDPVRTLLREPLFVPETMGVAQLLRRFQAGNLHMAIVLDEYGTTAGLASVEDVLEQIVGDIGDEYDSPAAEPEPEDTIHVVEPGRVLDIPARLGVAEVNHELGTSLPEEGDWETVAGLVIATCNRIPAIGETVVIGGAEFRVLEADERRIRRLRVTAHPQPAEEPR